MKRSRAFYSERAAPHTPEREAGTIPRRGARLGLALLAAALGCTTRPPGTMGSPDSTSSALMRFEFEEAHMGTPFRIVLYEESEARAQRGARAAFARIAELDTCLSDYDPESELSRLSGRTTWQRVSADLWRNLVSAERIWRASNGAFDVTVGPLSRLWRRARRQAEPPSEERLEEALGRVGFQRLELDEITRSLRFQDPAMGLDLGGIAKGDALDQALAVLGELGIECALIDGGGDVVAGAPPPGGSGWTVALPSVPGAPSGADARDNGSEVILLARAALATSGDTERGFEHAGRRHSHIVDPRTGRALVDSPIVTVLAKSASEADAWASALSVLGIAALEGLSRHGVEARLLTPGTSGALKRTTAGFPEKLSSKGESQIERSPAGTRPAERTP